jgi:hypothetical protein
MKHPLRQTGAISVNSMVTLALLAALAFFAVDAMAVIPTVQGQQNTNGDFLASLRIYATTGVGLAVLCVAAFATVIAAWLTLEPVMDWNKGRKTWGEVSGTVLTIGGVLVVIYILLGVASQVFA